MKATIETPASVTEGNPRPNGEARGGLAAPTGYAFLEVWWYIGSRRDVCYMVGPYRTDIATKLADWINAERKCHTRRKDAKVVTRTKCRRFSAAHYGLACKPQWVKRLLRRENARIDAAKKHNSELCNAAGSSGGAQTKESK